MKKISLYLFTIVFVIVFAACSGSKKSDTPAEEPVKSEAVEEVAPEPVVPAKTPAEMLKEFQDYAKAYGEAFNNLSKDPKTYTDLSRQSQKWVTDMENIKSNLNARQLQDYQRSLDIVLKVNRGGK